MGIVAAIDADQTVDLDLRPADDLNGLEALLVGVCRRPRLNGVSANGRAQFRVQVVDLIRMEPSEGGVALLGVLRCVAENLGHDGRDHTALKGVPGAGLAEGGAVIDRQAVRVHPAVDGVLEQAAGLAKDVPGNAVLRPAGQDDMDTDRLWLNAEQRVGDLLRVVEALRLPERLRRKLVQHDLTPRIALAFAQLLPVTGGRKPGAELALNPRTLADLLHTIAE